jgi:AMP-binding enzyme/Phosphopantetheine attachment site
MRAPGSRPALEFVDSWERHPDRPALITDRATITYEDLASRVAGETELFGPSRRLVLIELQNTVSAIVSYLAALRAGNVVLIASDAGARESLAQAYDPDVVVGCYPEDAWQMIERRTGTRHDLHPDLALLSSTSGSTGSPKLVRLSYENLDSNARSIAEYLGIGDTDRAMTLLPLSYCYGLSVLHSHLARGAAVIVTADSVVDADFWSLARSAQATAFAGVPYTFELLDLVGFAEMDLPSLRYITQAGGKMDADRVLRYAELGRRNGWDLVVMYGQTEATARMAYLPADRVFDAPEAIGLPIPGGRFTIDDDGELIYHGPNVMLGYAQSPGDLLLGRTIDHLRTGDLARHRPDGLYEIVGRRSRFLKLVGLRVDLDQLERGLRLDGIQAFCGGDDTALIVAVETGSPDPAPEICAKVGLPANAVRTVYLDELPRLANGKPDYAALSAYRDSPASMAPPKVGAGGVRAVYKEMLPVAQVTDSDTFVGLGGDSLTFIQASQRLERELGRVPTNWHLMTVAELEASSGGSSSGPLRWMETSVVLRAVAIVLVCANHVGLTHVWGAAHILLAGAGYSFARFQVSALRSSGRVRSVFRSIARIAVPSAVVIAIAYLVTRDYDIWNVLLIEHVFAPVPVDLDPNWWDPRWNYWFIEALVSMLLVFAALLSIPSVRRFEHAQPFGFAVAILGVCLLLRFNIFGTGVAMEEYRPHTTVWLFALGWAAARASGAYHRLLLTAAALCGALLPGFFDDQYGRKLLVAAGLVVLIWVNRVPVLGILRRPTAVVAGASLWIYLTQPLTLLFIDRMYDLLVEERGGTEVAEAAEAAEVGEGQHDLFHDLRLVVAVTVAIVVGVVAWQVYERMTRQFSRLRLGTATGDGSADALRGRHQPPG